MNDEVRLWLQYADENRQTARLARESGLLNPCLHNCQQAVEKLLKAALLHHGDPPRRTHSIRELVARLHHLSVNLNLTDDDCDLLDSVYLPSKYPLGSALPAFDPDPSLCDDLLRLTDALAADVGALVGG